MDLNGYLYSNRSSSGSFPACELAKISTVGLPLHCRTWEATSHRNLMRARPRYRSVRNTPWAVKKALTSAKDKCDKPKVCPRTSKSSFLSEAPDSRILRGYCGVIEPSDLHPPFTLCLGPMPRSIIAYEEDNGDHDNSGNRTEDNPVLGWPKLR